MDRSIAQALNDMIPAIAGPLPVELLELAGSLLAQSRSKASSLKAEEEIARPYACANIAYERCERTQIQFVVSRKFLMLLRLKQTLALPQIQPRPPCPPRVYQKLYRYLDGAIPNAQRSNKRSFRNQANESDVPRTPTRIRTPLHERPSIQKPKPPKRATTVEDTSKWVIPVTRELCKKLGAPAAPPHVFAGTSSILSSLEFDQGSLGDQIDIKVPALLIALTLIVYTRLAGVETPSEEYLRQIELALALVKESLVGNSDLQDVDRDDVAICMRRFGENRWSDMDWFHNIQTGSGVGGDVVNPGASEELQSEDDVTCDVPLSVSRHGDRNMDLSEAEYLQAGLGTMIQDRVDYLSDERRRDFREWKAGILSKIRELEREEARS